MVVHKLIRRSHSFRPESHVTAHGSAFYLKPRLTSRSRSGERLDSNVPEESGYEYDRQDAEMNDIKTNIDARKNKVVASSRSTTQNNDEDNSIDAGQFLLDNTAEDNFIRPTLEPPAWKVGEHVQHSKKRSPTIKSSKSDSRTSTISASTDRLTMLEVPPGELASSSYGAKNTQTSISNKNGQSNTSQNAQQNRETILSAAQANSSDRPNQFYVSDNETNTSEAAGLAAAKDNGQLLLISIILVLFLSLGLVIYTWFYKGRVKKRPSGGDKSVLCGGDQWHSPQSTGSARDLRKRNTRDFKDCYTDDANYSCVGDKYTLNKQTGGALAGGEQIQLLDRKPRFTLSRSSNRRASSEPANGDTEDADEIQQIAMTSEEDGGEPAVSVKGKPISTMVTLRRKLNKSSVFMAAKSSARPKVRLISNRVRKFIDDEAEEMKSKCVKRALDGTNQSFANRVLAYLFTSVASDSRAPSKDVEDEKDQEAASSLVVKVQHDEDPSKISPDFVAGTADDASKIDNSTMILASAQSDKLEENLEIVASHSHTLNKLPHSMHLLDTAIRSQHQKLSPTPSPVQVHDACSSLSGCSLFSASPMQDNTPPTCDCVMLGARGNGPAGIAQPGEFGSYGQCQSQCHSPYPLSAGAGGSGPSPVAIYRPCCSVSPSALINQRQLHASPSAGQRPACYHSASDTAYFQQQQQVNLPLEAHRPRVNSATAAGQWSQCKPLGPQVSGKSNNSNLIKRQYENYYDDENEDAYRRLTASFGMELGLHSLGHHHHHHSGIHNACYSDHHHHIKPQATTAGFVSIPPHPQPSYQPHCHTTALAQQVPCKCCSHGNQLDPTGGPALHSISGQNLHPSANPYFYKQAGGVSGGGSAGELISTSASTSLGGSDSGFAIGMHNNYAQNTSNQICRDPLCACRSTGSSITMPAPPMSILVQQPSLATPPPPQHRSPVPDVNSNKPKELGACSEVEGREVGCDTALGQVIGDSVDTTERPKMNPEALLPLIKSCNSQAKWKHRRHLSQRVHTDLFCNKAAKDRSCSNIRRPRRVSVSGDQVSSQAAKQASGTSTLSANQIDSKAQADQASACLDLPHHRAPLASTSMDASHWNQSQIQSCSRAANATAAPTSSGYPSQKVSQQPGHSYPLTHNMTEPLFGVPISTSHRPSDASLYEIQSCSSAAAMLNGKNSYNSSTSSGIGISGSTCTNTPTASAFPYGSFATSGQPDMMTDYSAHGFTGVGAGAIHAINQQHQYPGSSGGYQWLPPQCNPMVYNLTHGVASGAQAALESLAQQRSRESSSRKYSLPVHLESQAAERLSPNRVRPLFEKNLHRVDSANAAQQKQQPLAPTGESQFQAQRGYTTAGQYPGSSLAWRQVDGGRTTLADSRRSSQTITRQSSFWLDEDNDNCTTVDSMLSMSTGGPSASYEDPFQQQQQSTANIDRRMSSTGSQRPSLGSLVLSGDSIESVKLRPLVSQPTIPDVPATPPTLDDEQLESMTEDKFSADLLGSKATTSGKPEEKSGLPTMHRQHLRNRLSSSTSTSSTTSSPSPDFSRPSERILALASKSSSISKRHLLAKLHRKQPKRLPRLGTSSSSSGGSTNTEPITSRISAPLGATGQSFNTRQESGEDADTECAPECSDNQVSNNNDSNINNQPTETITDAGPTDPAALDEQPPASEIGSASLERQCRDLWKLRATLHNDSCTSDNWNNYHQRLNRRYDSGYKSVEKQLSSSLEGNLLAASSVPAPASSGSQSEPTSGHSETSDQPKSDFTLAEDSKSIDDPIEHKLAELELNDVVANRIDERECSSRSSKSSSGEDEKKKEFDTGWSS